MAAVVAAAAAPAMASAAASMATQAACCVCGSCASKLCCGDRCCGINSSNVLYFLMWLASALASFLLYVMKHSLLGSDGPQSIRNPLFIYSIQQQTLYTGLNILPLSTARLVKRFSNSLAQTAIRAAKRHHTFSA